MYRARGGIKRWTPRQSVKLKVRKRTPYRELISTQDNHQKQERQNNKTKQQTVLRRKDCIHNPAGNTLTHQSSHL